FLLERIPEIGSEIMETLKNRAVAVTETVKESGIDIKELPDNIKNAKFDNASRGMVLMTMIARQIRSANENLANVNDSENKIEFQKNSSESVLKLLPLNYENYNIEDHNDNIMYLNKATVNCPYCGKVFEEYIPLFSVLKNSREFPDGRIKYYEFDILRYTNIVCSCCNYTDAYQEFFKQYETDSALKFQENQFKNAENFTGYANSLARTMDETILSYYLNLECLKRVTTAPLRYAKAWIRLYWIYNDLENEIFMKKAGERAYHYYNEYFHKSTEIISNFDKVRINTIIEQLSKFK
ncbi:MAG: DUF2225 domain-containing protein, partial [Oscillospiraceae bacterium]|nr:DUF2225 domain-containing protein [Oscillospiraceae bacterium]